MEAGDEIILYIPDIYEDYPNMASEGWTLSKAEEFSTQYGLVLSVKDKKGNTITDYSAYLDKIISGQNRTGKIASGVTFTVTIDVDMSSYNLIINYIDKSTNQPVFDTKTDKKKDGESGSITCPGKAGYTTEQSSISYRIDGRDVTVNCYYTKNIVKDNTDGNE